jgi:mono/diheme cytochrome c family protein
MFVVLALSLYWGMVYFDQRSGWFDPVVYGPYHSVEHVMEWQPPTAGEDPRGKEWYEKICALCHDPAGTGHPGQAPPFIQSEWALGSVKRMIRIPQCGLTGAVTVHGQNYATLPPMAAMGSSLSDSDLAAVLTYIRKSWGNTGSKVTPEEVKAVRDELKGRTQPFTEAELKSIQ